MCPCRDFINSAQLTEKECPARDFTNHKSVTLREYISCLNAITNIGPVLGEWRASSGAVASEEA